MLGSMMFEGGEIIRERIQRYQIASATIAPAACLSR